MTQRTSRRQFLAQAGAGLALPLILPRMGRGQSPNETLQVGFVAAGGQAGSHVGAAHGMKLQCICFAEVDKSRWGGLLGREGWGQAVGYTDWRQMFEKMPGLRRLPPPSQTHYNRIVTSSTWSH